MFHLRLLHRLVLFCYSRCLQAKSGLNQGALESDAAAWEATPAYAPPQHSAWPCNRGKAWGVQTDLRARTVHPATHPMPPLLLELAARMRQEVSHCLA